MTPIRFYNSTSPGTGGYISQKYVKEIWEILLSGGEIFVEYDFPSYSMDRVRKGTIGRVKFSPRDDASKFIQYDSKRNWDDMVDQFVEDFYLDKVTIDQLRRVGYHNHLPLPHILARFDGRPNKLKPDHSGLIWLKDYTGPTVWKNSIPSKKSLPRKIVKDRLGRELNVGDFITYILYHHTVTGAGIFFGTVTKITDAGKVFAKNIKMGDTYDRSEEKQIKDPSQAVIMTKDLMDQIVLKKLSG